MATILKYITGHNISILPHSDDPDIKTEDLSISNLL